jgi:radical SAM protein with 4Fe4S-binding SPASM domain
METPVFPKYLQVETMNKCNLKCTMCPITLGENKRPNMDFELYEKIIAECGKYSSEIEMFGPYLLNEPLLDQSLPEKIKLAKKNGLTTYIATNGTLLSTKNINALFDSGLNQLVISVDSIVPEVQEKIRVGTNFDSLLKNLENLFELKKERNDSPLIIMRQLSFSENKTEHDNYVDYWIKKGADSVVIDIAHNWGGKFSEINSELVGMNICKQLWEMFVIQSDGNVCLCCLDSAGEFSLGNVKDQSIYDIWHGKKFNLIRKQFLEKQLDKCRNCNWTPDNIISRTDQTN